MTATPKSRTVTIRDPATNQVKLTWSRNWIAEKPLPKPLPDHSFSFSLYEYLQDKAVVGGPYSWLMKDAWPSANGVAIGPSWNNSESEVARNKALTKLQGEFGEQAMAIVNVVERKQAYNSLLNRSLQLIAAVGALKRGNLKAFATVLGTSVKELEKARRGGKKSRRAKKRTSKSVANDVSGTWLEYHFGWEPLVKDIYNSVQILQSDYPVKRLVKKAGVDVEDKDGNRSTADRWRVDQKHHYGWRLSADLKVSNPNLFKATQLGLVNPAAVAWELVPFSFVVDWFIPVGEFLNSYSNFFGIEVSRPLTTVFQSTVATYSTTFTGIWSFGDYSYRAVHVKRMLELPSYSLRVKTFKGFSVARGATAIALLIQQLKH